MTRVGTISIETTTDDHRPCRNVRAAFDVGGSLISIQLEAAADPDLLSLVEHLIARLQSLAIDEVRKNLQDTASSE